MHTKTISELSKLLKAKKISSVELTKLFLDRIKKHNPTLNAFLTITEKEALEAAKRADQDLAQNKGKSLTGIPIAHKDIFCTKDVRTTAGSKILGNFVPPYNGTMVERLNEAGAILLGKTNCDEFAMGSSNENSAYGPVKNPWDLETVPGGSSGGSAAAIAARLIPAASGTDTGGSIRQPASLSGITGLKPTYGRISRYGTIAFASSLDHVGFMAQTAEDIAILMNVASGMDPHDSTSSDQPVPDYTKTLSNSVRGLRIGIPKEYFSKDLDPAIAKIIMDGAKELQKFGATLHDIELPHTQLAIPTYYIIAPAECSSNLARFDGIRYGYKAKNPVDLQDLYERTRAEGFGSEVKHRIMVGVYVLSSGYYDAYYVKAQKVRQLISMDYKKAFESVDVILAPTSPSAAFKIGSKSNDRVQMYLSDIFTVTGNLAGLPAMSIPCGMQNGLPIGLQLTANYFEEARLLNVAHQYQQVTDWHKMMPKSYEL